MDSKETEDRRMTGTWLSLPKRTSQTTFASLSGDGFSRFDVRDVTAWFHRVVAIASERYKFAGNAFPGVILLSLIRIPHDVPSILRPRRRVPLRGHRAAPHHLHLPPVSPRRGLCPSQRPVWEHRSRGCSGERHVPADQPVESKPLGRWRILDHS